MTVHAKPSRTHDTHAYVWRVADIVYPAEAPFNPIELYPEYQFDTQADHSNCVYDAVRNVLHLAGLDTAKFGTANWNPLGGLVRPGETVLIKPNLIKERHPRDSQGWKYVLTHGSVIRAIADYVWIALDGRGKVVVADAPQTDSSFRDIVRVLGLDVLQDFYAAHGLPFQVIDLRREEWLNQAGVIIRRKPLPGDPVGSVRFDLGHHSEFAQHPGEGAYYGADYDTRMVNEHHSGGRHEYLIAATAIHADVVINVPKLKTHKKAGITVGLKNLVGITADKNWLPHHTEGHPSRGGDERPDQGARQRTERIIAAFLRRLSVRSPGVGTWIHKRARRIGRHVFGTTEEVIRSGNWFGNDTVWRMCLDLNRILMYGRPDGTMRSPGPESRKRHYVLVDGLLGGQCRGPMNPDPVAAGIIVFGLHPASVDAACACLMGFDPERIPIVRQAFLCKHYPLAEWGWRDVEVISNEPAWNALLPDMPYDSTLHFEPHFGWKGHIERRPEAVTTPTEG